MFLGKKSLLIGGDVEDNFWPTFGDLMSGIIMIILLCLMIFIIIFYVFLQDVGGEFRDLIGVRRNIVEDLKKEFNDSNLQINVDPDSGEITFSGDVLFEVNKAEIKPEFKARLREFIPRYLSVLLSEKNKEHISHIIVEGHTDDDYTYQYNLKLSQSRALAVVEYILSEDFPSFKHKRELNKYITANGRSYSALVYRGDGSVDKTKSRRVEFKFDLKDEVLLKKLKEVIDQKIY